MKANDTVKPFKLTPVSFTSKWMEGQISQMYHVIYDPPLFEATEPSIKHKTIPFASILKSGIQSLLFEYKNYKGQENVIAYNPAFKAYCLSTRTIRGRKM
jgi:hypothetical protein